MVDSVNSRNKPALTRVASDCVSAAVFLRERGWRGRPFFVCVAVAGCGFGSARLGSVRLWLHCFTAHRLRLVLDSVLVQRIREMITELPPPESSTGGALVHLARRCGRRQRPLIPADAFRVQVSPSKRRA
ncbi:hypothetical protein E2C01_054654 [Portunus trituberculatus]|uniref:Uncharacterized protein n=1 Tax=Portunus trituberculatus TaxID=210409 RepID=A0A5B7GKG3_PORTR|nr:hypothetical protein [Portunus trituberculatus]